MNLQSNKTITPLPCAEVIKAVERRTPSRIPLVRAKWWGEGLWEQYGERLNAFDRYPEDVVQLWIEPLDYDQMGLSWEIDHEGAHDARIVLDDWGKLDEFIAKLPDPATDPQIASLAEQAEQAHAQDRYVLFSFWRLFFERPWSIRGMTNLLMDYYTAPAEIHRLHDALCTLYCGYIEQAIRVLKPHGFWTSDDLGHQKQPFMRPRTFREYLKPYYVRIGETLRRHNLHWWLHSCGNNTPLLPDLIEAGVDVFHPVQKHTMDEVAVAREFGDRLTFLAGIDVQHVLQEQSPDAVRAEVRFLIDTFDRPDGGMCLAAGNGIVAGTPFENIEAFLDEAARYGTAHRQQFA
ncbi:MAG TPA: uroporphyrinogen decarboxylase family protein [Anaerolineae bacterium]|nr:uroporphyrinogen decarboxylase family protein [Anaerolineae bacterium]